MPQQLRTGARRKERLRVVVRPGLGFGPVRTAILRVRHPTITRQDRLLVVRTAQHLDHAAVRERLQRWLIHAARYSLRVAEDPLTGSPDEALAGPSALQHHGIGVGVTARRIV